MMASEDLINFDVIESQKENVGFFAWGPISKAARASIPPSPLHKLSATTPSDTSNIKDCIRAEYEAELANISESDDPLDIYDRYVRWTLDAYPSAQRRRSHSCTPFSSALLRHSPGPVNIRMTRGT